MRKKCDAYLPNTAPMLSFLIFLPSLIGTTALGLVIAFLRTVEKR